MNDDKKLALCRAKLQKLIPFAFSLSPNGILTALDVNKESKEKLLQELKPLANFGNLSATKYRLDNGEQLYKIFGKIDIDRLTESVELHDTLNPKIWDENQELLPEVRKKIEDIVELFKTQLEEDGVKLIVEDIYLLGSNANFNYNDDSDLDIHIIADDSFDCDSKHLDIIYTAYKTLFNNKYDINFKGINIEIYVESKNKLTSVTSGLYSLKKGWIKKPARYNIPEIDEASLEKSIEEWEKRYLELVDSNPELNDILTYIDDIYELRKEALKSNNEFEIGNLTFKEIRRLGYLDELKQLRDKILSNSLSL